MTDSATEAPAEPVLVKERRGAVEVLRLNRPEARNALNPELLAAIGLAMLDAEKDTEVRAVVLTGTGDRAFCAGMDLRGFAEGGTGGMGTIPTPCAASPASPSGEIRVPMIGAANATAVAGGFELLLGCDVVVASETASFGLPEVKRGLFAAGGGVFVSTRIPLAVALELHADGRPHRRQQGTVPGSDQPGRPSSRGAPRRAGPGRTDRPERPAGTAGHEGVGPHRVDGPGAGPELAAEWQPKVFGSDDAKEGATAFIEKRDPVWKGRWKPNGDGTGRPAESVRAGRVVGLRGRRFQGYRDPGDHDVVPGPQRGREHQVDLVVQDPVAQLRRAARRG